MVEHRGLCIGQNACFLVNTDKKKGLEKRKRQLTKKSTRAAHNVVTTLRMDTVTLAIESFKRENEVQSLGVMKLTTFCGFQSNTYIEPNIFIFDSQYLSSL